MHVLDFSLSYILAQDECLWPELTKKVVVLLYKLELHNF